MKKYLIALFSLLASVSSVASEKFEHSLLLPAFSKHQVKKGDLPPGKSWNENNTAFGYKVRLNSEGRWSTAYFGEYVLDSFGKPGFLAGSLRQIRLTGANSPIRVDAGLAFGAWNRRVSWEGRRMTVPVVAPVLSFSERETGFAAHVSFTPRISKNGEGVPAVVMFQLSTKI